MSRSLLRKCCLYLQIARPCVKREVPKRFLLGNNRLGMDGYMMERQRYESRLGSLKGEFHEKVNAHMSSATATVFSEDLKTIIHIAEDTKDLELAYKMMVQYEQADVLRFSKYKFGPVAMRMLHYLKQPDLAYSVLNDKRLERYFVLLSSYVVMMDLLYEAGQMEKVLEVMDRVTSQQLGGIKYPPECSLIACAACLKMNNHDGLSTAMRIIENIKVDGAHVPLRSYCFAAMLALNLGQPEKAVSMISHVDSFMTELNTDVLNIKLLTCARLGDIEQGSLLLKQASETATSEDTPFLHVFKDVVTEFREAANSSGNTDILQRIEQFKAILESNGQISDINLEKRIWRPVSMAQRPRGNQGERYSNKTSYPRRKGQNHDRISSDTVYKI